MELKETNHSYYCSGNNYYVNGRDGNNHGRCDYDSWNDFKEDWMVKVDNKQELDDDYNHIFRFDIVEKRDEETDESTGQYELWLFFIQQRKGNYVPVRIKELAKENIPDIEKFLKDRWDYLKKQWIEFSK